MDVADTVVNGFATDSGSVLPGSLFLAIKGMRVDGHDFVPDALAKGAVAAVVERPVSGPHLLVPNLVDSLAKMALSFRSEFTGPVVGVTGSAGKTTTKEFLAAALAPLGTVLKSEGNRNTEFSSPLIWAELNPEHRVAVIEMAMRGMGQIAHLASFSRPTVGLITNIGYSHLEQVGSREGIAQAKSELFLALPSDGLGLYWAEDDYAHYLAEQGPAPKRTFGFSEGADCRITHYEVVSESRCRVAGRLDGERWEVDLPSIGRHFALNAAAAILVATSLGVTMSEAASELINVNLPPMRMEIRQQKGVRVLLDAYNASPASMQAAIEALMELPDATGSDAGRRSAVVGEMRELGSHQLEAHDKIGRYLVHHQVDEVIFVGEGMRTGHLAALDEGADPVRYRFAESLAEVTAYVASLSPGDTLLIKGSRALELERVLGETS